MGDGGGCTALVLMGGWGGAEDLNGDWRPRGNLATGRSCCQIRIWEREITTLLPPGLRRAGGLQHVCVCVCLCTCMCARVDLLHHVAGGSCRAVKMPHGKANPSITGSNDFNIWDVTYEEDAAQTWCKHVIDSRPPAACIYMTIVRQRGPITPQQWQRQTATALCSVRGQRSCLKKMVFPMF